MDGAVLAMNAARLLVNCTGGGPAVRRLLGASKILPRFFRVVSPVALSM